MPKKQSKRYRKALELVEPGKRYSVAEAADLVGKFPKAKFDESIELAFKMSIDPRKTDQMIRGTVRLPNGSGKEVKVLVFAKEAGAIEAAKAAGAEFVGFDEFIEKVTSGWTGFDVAIATPEAMGEAAAANAARPLLKLKLDGEKIIERVAAVRAAACDSTSAASSVVNTNLSA